MIIYIEDIFFEGFFTYFIAFFLALKTLSKKPNALCILVGVIGGLTYIVLPLIDFAYFGSIILQVLICVLCTLLLYPLKNILAPMILSPTYLLFFMGLKKLLGEVIMGVAPWIILTIFFVYAIFIMSLIRHFYNIKRHKKFEYRVTFTNGNNVYSCTAYLDSGNMLTDTSGLPIIVIDYKAFLHISGYNIENIITKTYNLKNSHYIDYSTISSSEKMLVFEIDSVEIEGREKKCLLGLNLKGFGGEYSALLNVAVI